MTLLDHRVPETFRERCTPVLETERLTLRGPRLEDAKAVAQLANDRRIAENTARIPHPYSLVDAEKFIASVNGTNGEIAFLIMRQKVVLGAVGISMSEREPPELGYWLGVPFWGHGYATEAVRAVIDHAFADLEFEALGAGARVTNPASRRVLEKCGFQWIGVGLTRIRALASSAPVDRFRLERAIWRSLKSWGAVKRVA
jgi:RimJ/RimL family protein N-acetyltransferase